MTSASRTGTVEQTAACEASQHHRCASLIISLTAAHGTPCGCACHTTDD
jgi:hypothetical protein